MHKKACINTWVKRALKKIGFTYHHICDTVDVALEDCRLKFFVSSRINWTRWSFCISIHFIRLLLTILMSSVYDWQLKFVKSLPIFATTRYVSSNTAPCSMYNFLNIRLTCEMVLWVELKEEEQSKGGEGWEKEIESIKPSPKPSVIYHHLDVYTVYHLTFDICYCARRNVGILINAGAKKAFKHFNAILINLCLYLYLGKRSFFYTQCLGKCFWTMIDVWMHFRSHLQIIQ